MAHLPGKFVWFELNTANPERAKKFYGELFGWKINSVSMNGQSYQMINNGEIPIGGFGELQGEHSHWISYLSVANVDEAVAKVKKGGGKLVVDAMEFPGVGRFALVADPQGGHLFAFKAEKEDAPDRQTKHGDWCWNELFCADAEKAARFYSETFGVKAEAMEMPGQKYIVLKTGETPRAGVMTSPMPNIPTHWLPYVQVDKVDDVAKRAAKLGGSVVVEPTDIPTVGRYAILKDQDGSAIGVLTPSPR